MLISYAFFLIIKRYSFSRQACRIWCYTTFHFFHMTLYNIKQNIYLSELGKDSFWFWTINLLCSRLLFYWYAMPLQEERNLRKWLCFLFSSVQITSETIVIFLLFLVIWQVLENSVPRDRILIETTWLPRQMRRRNRKERKSWRERKVVCYSWHLY